MKHSFDFVGLGEILALFLLTKIGSEEKVISHTFI